MIKVSKMTSVTAPALKPKVKADHIRQLVLELQGGTCRMESQCYLPPDTSERAPS